ncbi:GNAT family N-acetyltransferase [Oscillatoria sp. FACHB-1406]|uniref:GNAT family N-acetyltransferase n=1 Tax=Oscillatoria sp. FACHB-1406 TaxID=2692846 RepID=UPI001682D9F7|nr:GNAT family N-acetyltransferase [Oscillatoria sp. FACHB-1406]MBD2577600.1 N-acetyltransferase [Oscillatoria sp. FACHB-1406]
MATIRDAAEADLPEIVKIYNASIPDRKATADTEPVSVESRCDWFAAHSPTHYPLLVVELKGEVIAWLSFRPFYGRPAYRSTAEVSIYVDPCYHRHGIGKFLLQQAIDRARDVGFSTLVAFIFAHNTASLSLFEQFNFQEWGYLPRIAELDGVERDLIVLGLRLKF